VRSSSLALGILFSLYVVWPARLIQAEGHAEISRPATGDNVAGVVTILGSASSAEFDHFELFFSYDPDPTDTWFPIGDPVSTQVSFGRLGLWDTTKITAGTYALRLTVTLTDGSVIQHVVRGIQVRGSTSERSSPRLATAAPSSGQGLVGPLAGVATATVQAPSLAETLVPAPKARGIPVTAVVLAGASVGVLGLVGLGAYVEIRRNLRARWGAIRSRRLHTGSKAEDRGEDGRP
jgi:hypothetical protein